LDRRLDPCAANAAGPGFNKETGQELASDPGCMLHFAFEPMFGPGRVVVRR
jgi:hypothetical protein